MSRGESRGGEARLTQDDGDSIFRDVEEGVENREKVLMATPPFPFHPR